VARFLSGSARSAAIRSALADIVAALGGILAVYGNGTDAKGALRTAVADALAGTDGFPKKIAPASLAGIVDPYADYGAAYLGRGYGRALYVRSRGGEARSVLRRPGNARLGARDLRRRYRRGTLGVVSRAKSEAPENLRGLRLRGVAYLK
jgi:hypothetical protein